MHSLHKLCPESCLDRSVSLCCSPDAAVTREPPAFPAKSHGQMLLLNEQRGRSPGTFLVLLLPLCVAGGIALPAHAWPDAKPQFSQIQMSSPSPDGREHRPTGRVRGTRGPAEHPQGWQLPRQRFKCPPLSQNGGVSVSTPVPPSPRPYIPLRRALKCC